MGAVDFYLSRCERIFTDSQIVLTAPDRWAAEGLRRCCVEVAKWALSKGRQMTVVQWPGDEDKPYQIPSWFASEETPEDLKCDIVRANMRSLLGAAHLDVLEFLSEQYREGKIVILTGHRSNICRYTSDLLKPSRAYWTPQQFYGYDYLQSWRNTGSLEEYDRLIAALDRDDSVLQYEYKLVRPDGALCSYQTDYYKIRDYLGEEIRVGVSRPADWSLLQPAPTK